MKKKENKDNQDEQLIEYRRWLVAAEQKSQEDFDKTILSLSGGALGISFIFLKDVIGPNQIIKPCLLLSAWLAWGFSTLSVLASYYLSHLALRRAISQIDNGTIYKQPPGGSFAWWTAALNATGAILFLVGVCCITLFAGKNFSNKGAIYDQKASITTTATPNTATKPTAQNTDAETRSSNGGLHSSTAPTTTEGPEIGYDQKENEEESSEKASTRLPSSNTTSTTTAEDKKKVPKTIEP